MHDIGPLVGEQPTEIATRKSSVDHDNPQPGQ
jgi:hypothetical protein